MAGFDEGTEVWRSVFQLESDSGNLAGVVLVLVLLQIPLSVLSSVELRSGILKAGGLRNSCSPLRVPVAGSLVLLASSLMSEVGLPLEGGLGVALERVVHGGFLALCLWVSLTGWLCLAA